ncbi:hypothetical protein [Streptomyces griseus]|nr:hypothetical protein [Streptomyces fimicarius]
MRQSLPQDDDPLSLLELLELLELPQDEDPEEDPPHELPVS